MIKIKRNMAQSAPGGCYKNVPVIYLYSLVEIESVTAEIFLIWTNVARTNVVWKNVAVTVRICSRCSQDPMIKVWSKSGQ